MLETLLKVSPITLPTDATRAPLRRPPLGIALWLIISTLFVVWLPGIGDGVDWYKAYLPALRFMLNGESPYQQYNFFNPPWVLLPLWIPSLLPGLIGRGVVLWLGIQSFAYTAYRMGARPIAIVLFMLNPLTILALGNANIDWMVALGTVLPPWLGLFFVLAKPHLAGGIALLWFVEGYERGGWREVARTFAPVVVVTLFSFLLYGFWPLKMQTIPLEFYWNRSLFPYSIPIGIALLIWVARRRHRGAALAAGACFSPYLPVYSLCIPLLALVRYPWVMVGMMWVGWLLRPPT